MNKKGWIIYNGHLPGKKFLDFVEWLQEAAAKKGINTTIIKNNHLLVRMNRNGSELLSKIEREGKPDFVLFGDKDLTLARQLEAMDIPVFNSSKAIEVADNKIDSYQIFAKQKLPIPDTIAAPKIFPNVEKLDINGFAEIGELLGFPLIIKEAFGSFGKQVYLVHHLEEMIEKARQIQDRPYLFQEFIHTSYGRDIRLNVVGNQVVAAMVRTAQNDFRANVTAGAKMEPYSPSKEEKALAVAATKAIGADYAGVDLLFGKEQQPVLCEINSNAHIRNIYNCTGINVADYIIDYVVDQLQSKEGKGYEK